MPNASDLVPDLSLGVQTPAPANPLGMVGGVLDLQNKLNQNQQFQQSYAARARAGQIIAAAPDFETGIAAAQKDPLVAGWGAEVLQSMRATQQLLTQTQGLQTGQNQSAMQAVIRGAATAAQNDPAHFGDAINLQLQQLDPSIAKRIQAPLATFVNSMTADLPSDRGAASAELQKRLVARVAGAGFTPEALAGMFGPNAELNVGDQIQTGKLNPVTGAFMGAASAPVGIAPGLHVVMNPDNSQQLVATPGMPGGGSVRSGMPQIGATPNGTASPGAANPLGVTPVGPASAGTAGTAQFEGQVQTEKELNEAASVAPANIRRLDALANALAIIKSGGGAQTGAALAQAAQAVQRAFPGLISTPTINALTGSDQPKALAAAQTVQSLLSGQAIATLRSNLGGMRSYKEEVGQALGSNSLSNDPDAMLNIVNLARADANQTLDRIREYPKFARGVKKGDPEYEGYSPNMFDAWYTATHVGSAVPPLQPGQVAGTSASGAKPDFVFDPKTQSFVPVGR